MEDINLVLYIWVSRYIYLPGKLHFRRSTFLSIDLRVLGSRFIPFIRLADGFL